MCPTIDFRGIYIRGISNIPEVVIYVSIAFKFTGYLANVMTLLHTEFYEDRPLTFRVIGNFKISQKVDCRRKYWTGAKFFLWIKI